MLLYVKIHYMLERVKESLDKTIHLRNNLFRSGHPYGIFLLSSPYVRGVGADGSEYNIIPNVVFSLLGWFFSSAHASDGTDKPWLSIIALGLGSAALSSRFENTPQGGIRPVLTQQRILDAESISITERGIDLGSLQTRVISYLGQQSYQVRDETGVNISEITPGDKILVLHVNKNAGRYRLLDPLIRIRAIRDDFVCLNKVLEDSQYLPVGEPEKALLRELSGAPLIGISHLIRLLDKNNVVPTWGIEVLPPPLRWVHAKDSQLVSNMFGGKRRVQTDDVRVAFVTPKARSRLLAA